MESCSSLDLPLELAADIFPIVAILRRKSVCKLWKTYLCDPEFSTHYSSTQEHHYVGVLLFSKYNSIRIAQLRSTETDTTLVLGCRPFIRDDRLLVTPDEYCKDLLVGSWSPFAPRSNLVSVSNPMTREFRLLQAPPRSMFEQILFGFSSKTREYKVLRIYKQAGDRSARAQVCTVDGSGHEGWRGIVNQSVPSPGFNEYNDFRGLCFNGVLHWITKDEDSILLHLTSLKKIFNKFPSLEYMEHQGL